ncbi:MAG: lysoplasmalogenase [Bacteroidota bacterium]
MKTRVLTFFYFITGILFILFENNSSEPVQFILKALIIPWLIVILLINLKVFTNLISTLMLLGLIFSWAGDMVLQFTFVPGLILFLLAHVMYLAAFFMTPGKSIIFTKRIGLLIPVLLYGAGLCLYLYGDLGDMRLPVIVYAAVILLMLTGALNRFEKVNGPSYRLVLAGAALFVLSDSAIAVNRFTWDFDHSGFVIMSTYIAAQYLITIGYIRQYTNHTR